MKKDIIILGGGASGLFLASLLNRSSYSVTLIEKNERVGKKLLVTGNGRCNLSNQHIYADAYNHPFALEVLQKFSQTETIAHFEQMGLMVYTDQQKRIYPISESANTVLDVLRHQLNHIKVITNTTIQKINYQNNQYQLFDENNHCYTASILVLACGGKSYYSFFNADILSSMLHHHCTPFAPSLIGFKVKEQLQSIENLKVKAKVTLKQNETKIHEEEGEVLFKKDGLSGIVIFNMSSYYQRLKNKENVVISLDLLPHIPNDVLKTRLQNNSNALFGIFSKMLCQYLYKQSDDLFQNIKNLTFHIQDTYPFFNAQVTSGGVHIEEVDSFCQSKILPNLYLIGEMLDIDGVCGGYNLQFAFSSAGAVYKHLLRGETK